MNTKPGVNGTPITAAKRPHQLAVELFHHVDEAECEELTHKLCQLIAGHSAPAVILALAYAQAAMLAEGKRPLEYFLEAYPDVLRLCSTVSSFKQ